MRRCRGPEEMDGLLDALKEADVRDCCCSVESLMPDGGLGRALPDRTPEELFVADILTRMKTPPRPGQHGRGCRHTEDAGRRFARLFRGMTLEEWACLLEMADPEEHCEPPLPPEPLRVATSEARKAEYEVRESLGQSLFHPCDMRLEMIEGLKVPMALGKEQAGGVMAEDGLPPTPPSLDDLKGAARARAMLAQKGEGKDMGWSLLPPVRRAA